MIGTSRRSWRSSSSHRDARTLHLKLDELLRATPGARNEVMDEPRRPGTARAQAERKGRRELVPARIMQREGGAAARLAESVRRALTIVGPAESGMERVGDERPAERPVA